MSNSTASLDQLKQALTIAEKIEVLQAELASVLGATPAAPILVKRGGKRTMSAATIAKMRASQQARWAKLKGQSPAVAKTPAAAKKKRAINPEARAKMAAAAKKRWAAIKAGKAANPFASRGAKKK